MIEGRDIGTVVFPDADAQGVPDRPARACGPSAGRQEVADLDYETVAADLPGATPWTRAGSDSPLPQADGRRVSTPAA